jgi:hypothetical protein
LQMPFSSLRVMKQVVPSPGRWRTSTTPAQRTDAPSFSAPTPLQLVMPSASKRGRRNWVG